MPKKPAATPPAPSGDKVRVTFYFPRELRRRLAVYAAEQETDMSVVAAAAVDDHLRARRK
jgi:hypothetical protein